jgi:hypothetical protein
MKVNKKFRFSSKPKLRFYFGLSEFSVRKFIRWKDCYRMKNSLLRTNFTFPTNFSVTGRNTRSAHQLRLPFFLTSVAQSSIFYKGISLFNSLPNHLKSISRVSTFKTQLKIYVSNTIPIIQVILVTINLRYLILFTISIKITPM